MKKYLIGKFYLEQEAHKIQHAMTKSLLQDYMGSKKGKSLKVL